MNSARKIKLGIYVALLIAAAILAYIIYLEHTRPITKPLLNSWSIEVITTVLGQPDHISDFVLTDSTMYEPRGGLRKFFTVDKIKSRQIRIREYLWKDNKDNFVVWFYFKDGRWVSIDNLRWNRDYIMF